MGKVPLDERKLNPEQKKAVEFGRGPLLIIAGAGTGKTTVVTERIKHLIIKDFAKPHEILALTFTEKAAREMETRVDEAMPYGYTQMWISTFHAFCDQILRNEAIQIGLNPAYRLLTQTDATMMLRKNLFSLELEYFRPLGNPNKFIGGMLQHFSRLKDEDVTPNQYADWVKLKIKNQKSKRTEEETLELTKYDELAKAYEFYEKLKVKENVVDFSDLISNTLTLFRSRANILKKYQAQFKFILIDEFQDTNIAQNELLLLLAKNHSNITAVADDDQSIYKFRGAAVSNVLSFRKNFPNAELVVLTKNYRSNQAILDKAYKLIQFNNPDRLETKEKIDKKLISVRKDYGQSMQFIQSERVEQEAELVAKEIKNLVLNNKQSTSNERCKWKDIVILVRANNHAEPFMRTLNRYGIPYQFLGPGQLFRQSEVKDLIAYLQLLNNFSDNMAMFRVLSMDHFEYSARDLAALTSFSKKYNLSLFEAAEIVTGLRNEEKLVMPFISEDSRNKLAVFIKMVDRHLKLKLKETAGQILYFFLEDTGMLKKILEYKSPLDETKAENITKFFNKLKTYEMVHEDAGITAVLDYLLLSMDLGESPLAVEIDWTENDAVNILTVHSSKGLEFKVVFLVNLVAQRFPTTEKSEQISIPDELIKEVLPEGDAHLEEERRLFYVGMTRACDLLYFTAANYYGEGKRVKRLSTFVTEVLGDKVLTTQYPKNEQLSLLDWKKENLSPTAKRSKLSLSYISYSQIETFRTCPLHFKLKYVLKIPTPLSPSQAFGMSLHTTLKDFYSMHKQGETVTAKILTQLLERNWIREGYTEKRYEQVMFKKGEKFLKNYFETAYDRQTQIAGLEEIFNFPLILDGRRIRIGGRIDRVDFLDNGRIEIIDYKTGRLPSKQKMDTDLQLSIYALAATDVTSPPFSKKAEDIVLTLYYFDTQQKLTTTRTRTQLEEEKQRIRDIVKEIETSSLNCNGSQLCQNCEFQMFCGTL